MPKRKGKMADSAVIFTPGEVSSYYAARVPNLKPARGKKRRGPCPIHRGTDSNFAVDVETGLWICFSQCGNRGGDILTLEQALTGADFRTALAAVYAIVGRPIPDRAAFTREELRAWQEEQRQARREASEAGYFADVVAMLAEQALDEFGPFSPERAAYTSLIRRLRSDPVAVYCEWRRRTPEVAAALAEAGRRHQRRIQRLLLAYVNAIGREDEADAA